MKISEAFQIAFGILLASIGLKAFLLPNHFLDGGATGISILLSEILEFDISILLIIVSAPFLYLAWHSLSKMIFLKSVISIVALAIIIHYENFDTITDDKLLIAVFGGLFLGSGIGIAIKNGAVLDGSEILGIYINKRFGISIGKVILIFNILLFSVTAMILSIETAMYSILTFLVTSKVIDLMIEGFEDFVGLMIVSDHYKQIEKELVTTIGIGMTVYKGDFGYGKRGMQTQNNIIHTVVNRIEINATYKIIDKIDPNAFIIEFDVNAIKGGIFRKYLSKENLIKVTSKDKQNDPH